MCAARRVGKPFGQFIFSRALPRDLGIYGGRRQSSSLQRMCEKRVQHFCNDKEGSRGISSSQRRQPLHAVLPARRWNDHDRQLPCRSAQIARSSEGDCQSSGWFRSVYAFDALGASTKHFERNCARIGCVARVWCIARIGCVARVWHWVLRERWNHQRWQERKAGTATSGWGANAKAACAGASDGCSAKSTKGHQ